MVVLQQFWSPCLCGTKIKNNIKTLECLSNWTSYLVYILCISFDKVGDLSTFLGSEGRKQYFVVVSWKNHHILDKKASASFSVPPHEDAGSNQ